MHPPFIKKAHESGLFYFRGRVITSHQIRFIKRFIFLLIPYSLLRIGFYFYHLNIYRHFTQDEIFESFLLGIRFDVAAICLLNFPILVLAFLPIKNKIFISLERLVFVLINTAGFIVAIDDFELFTFMGKRLSFDLFVITDDILHQLPQILLNYWYLPLTAIFFGICFFFFDKKFFSLKPKKISWFKLVLSQALMMGLAVVGIRGGLQHKSINVQSAFVQGKNELGHLVLNSPYHFLRTLKNKPIEKVTYFKTDDEAKNIILNKRDFREGIEGKSKANVVLIILESFALEYMEKGYAPFLDELKKKSLFFDRHLANGRRSIESLPALLCGLPSLLDEPISKSIFQGNKFTCLPQILKDNGYSNSFFHAGARGTMGFESYTLANGFDRYFARDDYPNQNDYDGTWGIFDEPFMQFAATNINKMPEPFLAGIFTLTSHQPYTIPKKYRGKFPKGKLAIHESIGYTDYALRKFFERVEKEPWFKNTLFIVTSDHSQKLETKKYENIVGHYRVPLLFFSPGYTWGYREPKVTQHADIPSSVLDFVEIKSEELPATTVSVFSTDHGMALNYADGASFVLVENEKVSNLTKSQNLTSYHYDWETGELTPMEENSGETLKAYLQYFINGLIKNNLSLYR